MIPMANTHRLNGNELIAFPGKKVKLLKDKQPFILFLFVLCSKRNNNNEKKQNKTTTITLI